jgi:hypothetical protein
MRCKWSRWITRKQAFTRGMLLGCVAGLVVAAIGCGEANSKASVRGHVTFKGKPVTTGSIMFYPSSGPASAGVILEDGSYELPQGAQVGHYTVTIEAYEVIGKQPIPKSIEEEMRGVGEGASADAAKVVWQVPEKFASRSESTLTAQVEPGNQNEINFDL